MYSWEFVDRPDLIGRDRSAPPRPADFSSSSSPPLHSLLALAQLHHVQAHVASSGGSPLVRYRIAYSHGRIHPRASASGAKLTSQPNRKTPWRISQPQKARQRKRLRSVDTVVDTLSAALQRNGHNTKAVDRWYAEMPREQEMVPKDKYTIFDKKERKYRKGIHSKWRGLFGLFDWGGGSVFWPATPTAACCLCPSAKDLADGWFAELPKWTRVSQRVNPPGF